MQRAGLKTETIEHEKAKMAKFLHEWCKRLTVAAEKNDTNTISELTASMLSPDVQQNPIKLAINIDYEYMILDIVRALKRVEGLDSRRIAQLLILSSCPIKNVISQHNLDIVEHMISLGSPVNEAPDDHRSVWRTTALHSAVAGGDFHLRAVRLLLDNGANLHCCDSLRYTPLHRCLEARQCLEVLRLLVGRGARANTREVSGTPTLVTAIRNEQPLEVVQLLVQAGANFEARDNKGCAPIHYAARELRGDLVDYLLDLGVDPNTRSLEGESIVDFAIANASLDFIKYLVLICGVDLSMNSMNTRRANSVLHFAYSSQPSNALLSKRGYKLVADKIRFCLLQGADINARDSFGRNALQMSMATHKWLDLLLEHVAVCEFMNVPIDATTMRTAYGIAFCSNYIGACKTELVALMDLEFYNGVTFFNILTDDDAKMMAYARNDELVAAFQKISNMQLFLIYSTVVAERFGQYLELHRMRRKAVTVLSWTLRSVVDYAGVQEIVKYLNNRDLFKLSRFYPE